jgi:peptidoglycan/LPS O-acetylase OafA/YrhL
MDGRVLSIQWLRAVAALSVVAYHEIGAVAGYYPGWRPYHLIAGNIGVDIFFCISGFVMVVATCSHGDVFDPGNFLLRRLSRIAPTYWGLTLIFACLYLSRPDWFPHVARKIDLRHILSSLAFLPDGDPMVIHVGWTLSFEILFYLLIATVHSPSPRVTALRLASVAFATSLGHVLWAPGTPNGTWLTSPLMIEFCFGAGIGALYLQGRLARRSLAALAGCATIVVGFLVISDVSNGADGLLRAAVGADTGFIRVLSQGVPSALLILTLVSAEVCGLRLPRRGMIVCDASYSIYLIQALSEPASNRAIVYLGGSWPIATAVWSIGFTLIAGILLYVLFERPTTRYLYRRLRVRQTALPVPSAR